jgi:DNA-directed RNA polymerase III subunit RPC1
LGTSDAIFGHICCRRLGTSDKKGKCITCGGLLVECAGHFGHIKLELPVFHIGYFKHTIAILQDICKSCARVMVAGEERMGYLRKFRSPRTEVGAPTYQLYKTP